MSNLQLSHILKAVWGSFEVKKSYICNRQNNRRLFVLVEGSFMRKIYWKGVKRKVDKLIERMIDCILIFTNWLG